MLVYVGIAYIYLKNAKETQNKNNSTLGHQTVSPLLQRQLDVVSNLPASTWRDLWQKYYFILGLIRFPYIPYVKKGTGYLEEDDCRLMLVFPGHSLLYLEQAFASLFGGPCHLSQTNRLPEWCHHLVLFLVPVEFHPNLDCQQKKHDTKWVLTKNGSSWFFMLVLHFFQHPFLGLQIVQLPNESYQNKLQIPAWLSSIQEPFLHLRLSKAKKIQKTGGLCTMSPSYYGNPR